MKKLFLLFLIIFASAIQAQTGGIKITGTVLDDKGLSIPGATISAADGSTTTDFDGKYTIVVKSTKEALKFTFIGFKTQIIPVGNNKVINVKLVEEVNTLDEVIVVGYGTMKKSNITSSVSTYKNENMDQLPVSRVDQALQGKIAGVQVQNTSSAAGEAPVIRIRGQASINASPDPLVVVDGMPIDDGLASLNMADVQDVSVLKDASSAAIYGSRGANGVILVTTKSGSSKKTTYTFNNSVGFKSAYKLYDVQSTSDYVRQLYAERELAVNDPVYIAAGTTIPNVSTTAQAQYIFEQTFLGDGGVSYQDEFMRTGTFRNIGLSASGGGKGFTFRVSGAYNGDESMMQNSNYEKYQFRLKMNAELSKKVSIGVNIAPTYSKTERPANDYRDYYRFPSYLPITLNAETLAFVQQRGLNADLKVGDYANPQYFNGLIFPNFVMPDGKTYTSTNLVSLWSGTSGINPFKVLNLQDDNQDDFRVQSSFDLTYKITKDLTFKTTANAYFKFSDRLQWVGTNAMTPTNSNYAVYSRNNTRDLLSENTLNYVKDFDKHSINVLAGYSAQRSDFYISSFTGYDFPNELIRTSNNANTISNTNPLSSNPAGEYKNATSLLSYYGRIIYSYDGLFNLTGTLRRDGASQFGPEYKWGTFPSVSGGVNLAKLDFLRSSRAISKLNFRLAYGETGNNRTDKLTNTTNAYNPYLNTLLSSNYVTGAGNGTSVSGQVTPNDTGANSVITWETTVSTNLGFDLGLLKNRINISADLYESNTDKLLLKTNNQLFSGTALSWNNVGSLQNRGLELELSTTNIRTKDFRWTTVGNFAANKLKLTDFGGLAATPKSGERSELYITQVGSPLIQFYGYKTDGVWLNQEQITASGFTTANYTASSLVPGSLKFVDVDGFDANGNLTGVPDGKINTADRTVIGDPYADFTWGVTNSFEYKGFDMSFGFQGVQGIEMYQGDTGYTETKRQVLNYTANHWVSPSNPGDGQTPYENNGSTHWVLTDYGIDDASYIALREFTVGYTLDKDLIKKIGLSQLRMYFTGQNLLYFTAESFRGLNPESRRTSGNTYGDPLITGYDRGGYPIPKTLVFGFDVKF